MGYYLLDGVGAGFLAVLFGLGLLFIIIVILLEGWLMQVLKYHIDGKKSMAQSLALNLLSLGGGFVMTSIDSELFTLTEPVGFLLFFGVTVVLETGSLYLMNRNQPLQKTLGTGLLINLASYLLALILIVAI